MAIEANTTPHAVSSGALAKPATPTVAKSPNQMWKAIAPVAVAVVLALLPVPTGLAQHAWYFFSIFVGVIVGLVLEPLPGAAIALSGLTLVAVLPRFVLFSPEQLSQPGFRVPSAALNWALSGYSNPTVWLIFGAFILALGYERTGLGERIALILVKRMGKNTLLLGYGVTLADTILAPFIPSPTARSGGIIYPIVSDLAQVYESKPNDPSARRVGSYLMWVAIATTCVTSSLFLTAASFNLLAVGLVEKLTQTDVHWMDWFRTSATAIIPLLILIPLLSYWLYPPEVKHSTEVSKWAALEARKDWTPLPARTHPGGDCRALAGFVGWRQCFRQRNDGGLRRDMSDADHPGGDVERYYGGQACLDYLRVARRPDRSLRMGLQPRRLRKNGLPMASPRT